MTACPECGQAFASAWKQARYCSKRCRVRASNRRAIRARKKRDTRRVCPLCDSRLATRGALTMHLRACRRQAKAQLPVRGLLWNVPAPEREEPEFDPLDTREILLGLMRCLSFKQRTVVVLRCRYYRWKECAEVMGLSVARVKDLGARALWKMQRRVVLDAREAREQAWRKL